jgi:hypothetical protein
MALRSAKRGWARKRQTSFTGIQKLIPRYKFLNSGSDYVQKQLKYVKVKGQIVPVSTTPWGVDV